MFGLSCPVCKNPLIKQDKTYKCFNNHCFDIARQGYVNLLQSNKSKQKRHGDDKLMIKARGDFLKKGYYKPLRDSLCTLADKYTQDSPGIIDAGCGDCYYTLAVLDYLKAKQPRIIGVDISKDALIASRLKEIQGITGAVASVFAMPVCSESCDLVLNVFSPFAPEEYRRILKDGGCLIRVVPMENHLIELKEKIYDVPYKNPPEDLVIPGFILLENKNIVYSADISSGEDLQNLFKMTPYYYKTSAFDQKKLDSVKHLAVTCEFSVSVYKKSQNGCDLY